MRVSLLAATLISIGGGGLRPVELPGSKPDPTAGLTISHARGGAGGEKR